MNLNRDLENELRQLLMEKRWPEIEARFGHEVFSESVGDEFLKSRVRSGLEGWRILEPLLGNDFLTHSHYRLSGAIGQEIKLLSSAMVPGGLISLANLKHHVLVGSRRKPMCIHEKIYSYRDRRKGIRETELHSMFSASDLLSPSYFGHFDQGNLLSVFYESVEGIHPDRKEFLLMRPHILGKLWLSTSISSGCESGKETQAKALRDVAVRLAEAPEDECRTTGEFLFRNMTRLSVELKRLACFVMHGDLNRGNILHGDNVLWLIDWDKWSVLPVGSGARGEWLRETPASVFEFFTGSRVSESVEQRIALMAFLSSAKYFFTKERNLELQSLCADFMRRLDA